MGTGVHRKVAVAANGRRVGESHPKAKLTDHDVDLIRELATERDDAGLVVKAGLSYRVLAEKFDVCKWVIAKIVRCERRAVLAVRMVTLPLVPITES